jgi:transposase-like protein
MGVTEEGRVELLDFRVEMSESASAWSRFLQALYERGLQGDGLELIIHDGATGLIEALKFLWPGARTQVCAVHHLRNLGNGIRARHIRRKVLREAKRIFEASNRVVAVRRAERLAKRWSQCEPGPIRRFVNGLERTLVYMDFPQALWPFLKSTNPLERFFGEWRRRLKVMGALPNTRSLDRLLYALTNDFNGLEKRQAWPKSELLLT